MNDFNNDLVFIRQTKKFEVFELIKETGKTSILYEWEMLCFAFNSLMSPEFNKLDIAVRTATINSFFLHVRVLSRKFDSIDTTLGNASTFCEKFIVHYLDGKLVEEIISSREWNIILIAEAMNALIGDVPVFKLESINGLTPLLVNGRPQTSIWNDVYGSFHSTPTDPNDRYGELLSLTKRLDTFTSTTKWLLSDETNNCDTCWKLRSAMIECFVISFRSFMELLFVGNQCPDIASKRQSKACWSNSNKDLVNAFDKSTNTCMHLFNQNKTVRTPAAQHKTWDFKGLFLELMSLLANNSKTENYKKQFQQAHSCFHTITREVSSDRDASYNEIQYFTSSGCTGATGP
jgi:hypothetical protein